ncbi:hypothetical protein L0244_21525 [bacterium]|nr:hypothetical protein [bacterium]
MSKEGTNRIVVYKLTEGLQFEDLDLSDEGYYLEYSDNDKKLFIQTGKESVPKWLEY